MIIYAILTLSTFCNPVVIAVRVSGMIFPMVVEGIRLRYCKLSKLSPEHGIYDEGNQTIIFIVMIIILKTRTSC